VRKALGMLALVGLGVFAMPLLTAGAQTTTTTAGTCSFTVSPTTLPNGGGTVTVTGTAPAGSSITVFESGTQVATTTANSSGAWSVTVTVTATTDISASFGSAPYPLNACTTVSGHVVVAGAVIALAFTGSSHTTTYVLIGVAAFVVGLVLLVAARRRRHVA
jgi:LPXTG-motif cell wall-anchored protein